MSQSDIIVAGGGFPGIYAAWYLARAGAKVTLVDASTQLGGVMQARQWNGYWLDNGIHNLDLRSAQGELFYRDILQDDLLLLNGHCWASTTDNSLSPGFEMPDISEDFPELAANCLAELESMQQAENPDSERIFQDGDRYLDWYTETYGNTLTQAMKPMMKKVTAGQIEAVSVAGKSSLSIFSRPKLGDDSLMLALKTHSSFWDDRVGASLHSGDPRFQHSAISGFAYPARHALSGFCQRAEQRLLDLGVDIHYGSAVETISSTATSVSVGTSRHTHKAEKLLWTLPDHALTRALQLEHDLQQHLLPVGYCFYVFEVPQDTIAGPDYLHDFSPKRQAIRYSKPGVFSNQTKANNQTIILAEVPCHPKQCDALLLPANVDRIWNDLKSSGFLTANSHYTESTSWKLPVGMALPSLSWSSAYATTQTYLHKQHPNIVCIEHTARGRKAFMHHFDSTLRARLT